MLVKRWELDGADTDINESEIIKEIEKVFELFGIITNHEIIKKCVIENIQWNNEDIETQKL